MMWGKSVVAQAGGKIAPKEEKGVVKIPLLEKGGKKLLERVLCKTLSNL